MCGRALDLHEEAVAEVQRGERGELVLELSLQLLIPIFPVFQVFQLR
jgi:hypothetical protein